MSCGYVLSLQMETQSLQNLYYQYPDHCYALCRDQNKTTDVILPTHVALPYESSLMKQEH